MSARGRRKRSWNSPSQRSEKQRKVKLLWLCLVIAILAVMAAVLVRQRKQAIQELGYVSSQAPSSQTVEIGGITCLPRKNLKTYLVMGIDDTASDEEGDVDGGNCDGLWVLTVDQTAKKWFLLPIDRNTITAVDSLDEDGEYLAATDIQISLAHANGDGGAVSCENTVKAVSGLLGGKKLDGYAAIDLGGLIVMNDALGGVTVAVQDDMSELDPAMVPGARVTLDDRQAELFVRSRISVGNGTNKERMQRQAVFLKEASRQLTDKLKSDPDVLSDLRERMTEHMVTDLTDGDFSVLANALDTCQQEELPELTGTTELDENGWEAFYPNENRLNEIIIQLFYRPV